MIDSPDYQLEGFKLSFIVKFSIGGGLSVSGQPLGMSFFIILYQQQVSGGTVLIQKDYNI